MICVTGSSGTLGSEVIRQLSAGKISYRGAFFSEQKAEKARLKGIEAVTIDYNRPETLVPAFQDCEKLFLLGPNTPDQARLELNAVEAAKAANVRHIVKQSVMGAPAQSFSLAKVHYPVEVAVKESGIAWTFLRPNSFMQNLVTYMGETIRAEDTFYSASSTADISHVDIRDVAAVALKALTETGHEGMAYTLTGPEAWTYDQVSEELTKVLGRRIRHMNLSPSDYKDGMLAQGMPEEIADRMLDLERYFRQGHASHITRDIEQVTGQKARQYADYIRQTADSGIWGE
ncbi:SDR family oxidoreductase [Desulfospira joergensenii]|uniref:SDR family oxidoreductase n=1 Tax=Desulfospira joergensenii TaxID=53329 RepID=UPI0003B4D378|nr:SDR family oxidoreductase [Desulfospira joergensenii]